MDRLRDESVSLIQKKCNYQEENTCNESDIFLPKCLAMSRRCYIWDAFKDTNPLDLWTVDGFNNKATDISHYCTLEVLKKIIENESLRFTDIRFLNDTTEFKEIIFIIDCIFRYNDKYKKLSDFREFIWNDGIREELKDNRQVYTFSNKNGLQGKYRMYTCSFSTDSDSLSMWDRYTANSDGVSIEFSNAWNMIQYEKDEEENWRESGNVIWRKRTDDGIGFSRAPILYKSKYKEKCVLALLDAAKSLFDMAICESQKAELLISFKIAINNLRCFFKNEKYEVENEYRMVLEVPEKMLISLKESDFIKSRGAFMRGKVLVPFIDCKIYKDNIKRITMNPTVKADFLFELGVKELLWMNGLDDVEIVQSHVPMRNYN